ncbi:hypothetical protein F183_A33390 [Bryobacterales bacterium F-183]|nr:hypothetical protein F183_A33390 [Bryobacterales bacterium F-183]
MAITQQQFDDEVLKMLIPAADQARRAGLARVRQYFRALGTGQARELARLRAENGAEAEATLSRATDLQAFVEHSARVAGEIAVLESATQWKGQDTIVAGRIDLGALSPRGLRVLLLSESGELLAEGSVDPAGTYAIRTPREALDRKLGAATTVRVAIKNVSGNSLMEQTVELRAGMRRVSLLNLDLSGIPTRPSIGLEKIRGLGEVRAAQLRRSGIGDVNALISTPAGSVAKLLGLTPEQAKVLMKEAAGLLIDQ